MLKIMESSCMMNSILRCFSEVVFNPFLDSNLVFLSMLCRVTSFYKLHGNLPLCLFIKAPYTISQPYSSIAMVPVSFLHLAALILGLNKEITSVGTEPVFIYGNEKRCHKVTEMPGLGDGYGWIA